MKYKIVFFFCLLCSINTIAQNFDNLLFGSDNSLEVITWNIEQFPKSGSASVNYVSDIINALNADIIAIQEVSDISIFNNMVNDLEGYEGYIESSWFAGLAYIYKSDTIEINSQYEIFTESEFWTFFPRSPLVMDFNFNNERYIVINNHLKCCGDGILDSSNTSDEEYRRYFANAYLKEYIDTYFPNDNVILVGDLNDILTDSAPNNVFQPFLDADTSYKFADYDIANGSALNWSFPSWPSHLDHILISNELFDEFEASSSVIETLKPDDEITGGWPIYDQIVSDHRPVGIKITPNSGLSIPKTQTSETIFTNYPNPFVNETIISFNSKTQPTAIDFYNINGQIIFSLAISPDEQLVTLSANDLAGGIYFAKLRTKNTVLATRKIVVIK